MYPSYNDKEAQGLMIVVVMVGAFIALESWLFKNHLVWFWIVTTFTIVVVIYEVWRVKKERREWQSRSAKVG